MSSERTSDAVEIEALRAADHFLRLGCIGDFEFFEAVETWPSPIQCYQLFSAARGRWRGLWRDRESSAISLGIGELHALTGDLSELADLAESETLFGTIAFDEANFSEQWAGFVSRSFVLPEIMVASQGRGCPQVIFRVAADTPNAAAAIAKLREQLAAWLQIPLARQFPMTAVSKSLQDYQHWHKAIAKSLADIEQGILKKVVLSRRIVIDAAEDLDPGGLLAELALMEEDSFLFGIACAADRAFIGRSPERLMRWQGDKIAIDAIAGTRKQSGGDDQLNIATDLQNSQKDSQEHRYVTKYVRSLLQTFCGDFKQVEVEKPLLLRNVIHMRSQFTGQLRDGRLPLQLLARLHPTPAVCGSPKELAKDMIRESEGFSRGLFAGAVGVVSRSHGEFAIAIRSALVEKKTTYGICWGRVLLLGRIQILNGRKPKLK